MSEHRIVGDPHPPSRLVPAPAPPSRLRRIGVRLIYCDERGNELASMDVMHEHSAPERKWAIPLDAQHLHVTFLWTVEP